MKAVLMSIKPKGCELIAKGKKTIEVRKSRPKLETPFKCYVYMSQGKLKDLGTYGDSFYKNRMKVIGEFVCDRIEGIFCYMEASGFDEYLVSDEFLQNCKLSYAELFDYLKGKDGYGWHISNLKIYDKPKELGEFLSPSGTGGVYGNHYLYRAPQSWCYVEEL